MSNPNIAKLRKRAADFEAKKQFDRALSLYIQLLEEAGRDLDDGDLQLFNRVGDLLQRQGNVTEALAYYEKAVDVYAERGFLNNAIALCNKILRQSPARTAVYYKLGKISATKGFKSDAKKNFLEYADRMQKAGHVDEAFRALKEFADLCPDQDDIRLMLAEWLQKENRKSEAIEQLEVLYSKLEAEGRQAEARATIDRIKAIDPAVTPRASGAWQAQKSNDLVFLDLDAEVMPPPARVAGLGAPAAATEARPRTPVPPAAPRIPALDGLILTFDPDLEETPSPDAISAASLTVEGFEATGRAEGASVTSADNQALPGLERADPAVSPEGVEVASLLGPDARDGFASPAEPVPLIAGLETPRISLSGAHPSLAPLLDAPRLSGTEFADVGLAEHAPPGSVEPSTHRHDLALPSDLPLLGEEAGAIDLLRVVATPVGSDAESAATSDALPDLMALPPVGECPTDGTQRRTPVTGSHSPIDPEDLHRPVEAGATPPGEDATAAREERASTGDDRDTAELIAVDGSARSTDEILVVPSEVIDEETKRSLRLEFALDGDETPDAWVEAALGSRDDRSLDQSMDRLLTPLGMEAIAARTPMPEAEPSSSPPDPAFATSSGLLGEPAPEPCVEHASLQAAELSALLPIELPPLDEASSTPPPELDLLDELTPPFMRHHVGEHLPAPPILNLEGDEPTIGGSVLDVEALRALVEGQDDGPARLAADGRETADRGPGAERDTPLDEQQIEAAFADAARELPLLDIEGVLPPAAVPDGPTEIEITPFSVDELLGEAPTFGAEETRPFIPEPLFDDARPGEGQGASGSTVDRATGQATDQASDDTASPAPDEASLVVAPEAGATDEEVTVVAPVDDEASAPAATTDEWPADAAPEVLIDGEWRDEHMGDLVSGEVRAVMSFDPEGPRRAPRFDDLSAALLWPSDADDGEASAGAGLRDTGASAGEGAWVRRGGRAHTPHSTLSFGGVEAQLRRRLELDPMNLSLRQQLGEALLDRGAREEGLAELDTVMRGYEGIGNLEAARAVADVVLRVVPSSVRHHQKRVEYAVRSNDRVRLVEAYVELADSLFRSGEPDKARVVYARVLELAPGNGRARFALGLLDDAASTPREPTARDAGGEPSTPSSVSALFDPTVARPTPLRGVTPPFVTLPLIEDTRDEATSPEGGRSLELDGVNVDDLVAGERQDTVWREQDGRASGESMAESPSDWSTAAETDTESEAAADPMVEPFPPPSLDDAIDSAFATPPVVEIAHPGGGSAHPDASAAEDFAGTPPLGAAALVTPFATDDAFATVEDGFLLPVESASPSPASPGEEEASALSRAPTGQAPAFRSASQQVDAVAEAPPVVAAPLLADAPAATIAPLQPDDDFIDLGSWLREDEPVRSTRMVTEDAPPTGDEQADFDEMLRRFKQGVAANVDEEDYASHYDLGVAYKEMGLVDEAIAEFQKALRGDTHRVRSYEALGQCFVEKGQHQVAVTLLRRAAESTGADDQQLVGVLYLLGYASEVLARHADALGYYQRVFAVDIEFRDVAQRVAAMEHKIQ